MAAGILAIIISPVPVLIAPSDWFAWVISGALILGGGFSIFEARKGWCAIRAMGLWTPW